MDGLLAAEKECGPFRQLNNKQDQKSDIKTKEIQANLAMICRKCDPGRVGMNAKQNDSQLLYSFSLLPWNSPGYPHPAWQRQLVSKLVAAKGSMVGIGTKKMLQSNTSTTLAS